MPLSARNANTMWIMHFLHHLREGGTAGFVMATGELSHSETARLQVRQALAEHDAVDCIIVQLTGQLFANTQIPGTLCGSSPRAATGGHGFRRRKGEILCIDGRKFGRVDSGVVQAEGADARGIERVAAVYRTFRRTGKPEAVRGSAGWRRWMKCGNTSTRGRRGGMWDRRMGEEDARSSRRICQLLVVDVEKDNSRIPTDL